MRLLGEKILVELIPDEDTGIVRPDSVDKENPTHGTVKEISDDAKAMTKIEIGDKLLFRKFAPEEFEVDGKKLLILDVSDVMAVL